MIDGLNSAAFYDSLSNYSLYNNTDDNLFTNPYTEIQAEITNPVETGDLFSEDQSLFNLTDFEAVSAAEMQQSVENFESSISQLEASVNQLEDSFTTGSNEEIIESTENMLESYNQTLETLQQRSNYNSIEAAADLSESARLAEDELNRIGIEVGELGELTVNQERFKEALEENPERVNRVLNSESGFLNDISAEVNDLEAEPPSTFVDFGSEWALYSAENSAVNSLENGLIVDLYS
jgi:tetratricopeptide (TPR) repeat protein